MLAAFTRVKCIPAQLSTADNMLHDVAGHTMCTWKDTDLDHTHMCLHLLYQHTNDNFFSTSNTLDAVTAPSPRWRRAQLYRWPKDRNHGKVLMTYDCGRVLME
jgi:hypothetical protein